MNKTIFLTSLFVWGFSTFGFPQTYNKADSVALSVKNKRYKNIEDLVFDLTKNLETEEEKYRAFFVYITESFSYTYTHVNSKKALAVKKGNCSTIASLYKEMCDISNLKCNIVKGYIRNAHNLGDIFFILRKTNHAWNIIELDNEMAIVDATWGMANTLMANTNKVVNAQRIDFFFNSSPELFSLTHYPKKNTWSLTKRKRIKFAKQVALYRSFYSLVRTGLSFPKKINQRTDIITFTFNDSFNDLDFRIEYENTRLKPLTIVKNDDTTFTITFDISEIKRNTYFDLTYQELNGDEFPPIKPVLMYRKK